MLSTAGEQCWGQRPEGAAVLRACSRPGTTPQCTGHHRSAPSRPPQAPTNHRRTEQGAAQPLLPEDPRVEEVKDLLEITRPVSDKVQTRNQTSGLEFGAVTRGPGRAYGRTLCPEAADGSHRPRPYSCMLHATALHTPIPWPPSCHSGAQPPSRHLHSCVSSS